MIANLLLASALHGGPAVRPFDPAASAAQNAPTVRIWLNNNGRYRPGDKAKVTVRSSGDGSPLARKSATSTKSRSANGRPGGGRCDQYHQPAAPAATTSTAIP